MLKSLKIKLKSRRESGFTLIEILVVIAIIGVLSTIVLSSLNSARAKSRDARRLSDVKQIELALFMVADKNNGTFPSSGGVYRCLGATSPCWNGTTVPISNDATLNASIQEFLPSIPSDPSRSSGIGDSYLYWGPFVNGPSYHCGSTYPIGPYIVWKPENMVAPYSDSQCKGVGFYACNGGGLGYFCAYKIQ